MQNEQQDLDLQGHLPECLTTTYDAQAWCICDRLRACEQRVRMEDDDYAYVAAQAEADGRRRGWNEALDAAREAVAPKNLRSAYLVSLNPQEQRIAVSALELAATAIDALLTTDMQTTRPGHAE